MIEALSKRLCIITRDLTDLQLFELEVNVPRILGILGDVLPGYCQPKVFKFKT